MSTALALHITRTQQLLIAEEGLLEAIQSEARFVELQVQVDINLKYVKYIQPPPRQSHTTPPNSCWRSNREPG